jgi:hypothetical protein
LGGNNDNFGIVTLDWLTLVYTKHQERLSRKRWKGACTLFNGKDGEPLVAIAGGLPFDSKGMDIWNPADGTVELVTLLLPTETDSSLGLNHAQLLPINGGSEFILYGGFQGEYQQEIWKYAVINSTWSKIGAMLSPREEQVVLPVNGIRCRNYNFIN